MDSDTSAMAPQGDGDEEMLEHEELFSFDLDDADSEPILAREDMPPRPPVEQEEREPPCDALIDRAPPDLSPLVKPPVWPKDPAVTGKPIPWVIGLRFGHSCMTYRVYATLPEVYPGDPLLVDTREGEAVGWVVHALPREENRTYSAPYPGKILAIKRRLTSRERENLTLNQEKERLAKQICWRLIDDLKLEMRVSRVEYSLDGNKAFIYFTAENRVDFRELVKILSREIRARVELRQIGVRDETRFLGGIGPCGKVFCCSLYLSEFRPVSVRMAKNQDLSLNPESISGLCGRLMCCLSYENDAYLELRKALPKLNSRFLTKDGQEGVVKAVHPMTGSLELLMPGGERLKVMPTELTPVATLEPVTTPPVKAPEAAPPPPRERGGENRRPGRTQPPAKEVSPPPAVTGEPAPLTRDRRSGERPPRRPPARRPEGAAPAEETPPNPRRQQPPRRPPVTPEPRPATEAAAVEEPAVGGQRAGNRRRRFRRRPGGGGGTPVETP